MYTRLQIFHSSANAFSRVKALVVLVTGGACGTLTDPGHSIRGRHNGVIAVTPQALAKFLSIERLFMRALSKEFRLPAVALAAYICDVIEARRDRTVITVTIVACWCR
jgi:hypothetical protein